MTKLTFNPQIILQSGDQSTTLEIFRNEVASRILDNARTLHSQLDPANTAEVAVQNLTNIQFRLRNTGHARSAASQPNLPCLALSSKIER